MIKTQSIIRNKKAEIGETMTLLVATFLLVFIFVIFILITTFITAGVSKQSQEQSLKMSAKESATASLFAYLQTPVDISVGGKQENMEIADLIRIAYSNEAYQEILKEKTKEILDPVYGKKYFVHAYPIEIISTFSALSEVNIVETLIPAEKPIKIILGVIK